MEPANLNTTVHFYSQLPETIFQVISVLCEKAFSKVVVGRGCHAMKKKWEKIERRTFVSGLAAGAAAGLAGCMGDSSDGETDEQSGGDGTGTGTATPPPKQGGNVVFGAATAPSVLNPLRASDAYSWALMDAIYDQGAVFHPETQKVVPWAYEDWSLSDVESGKPTVTATLREGMTWSDGEAMTAEDVKFTVEYVKEQEPAGSVAASQYKSVESVDATSDREVTYHFSETDAGWLSDVIGNYIIPKHRWEGVSDYSTYTPRKEGGPVGSGAFVLSDFNWGNWFELSVRDDIENYPIPAAADFIHSDAPFVDTFRYEVLGSQQALVQAVLDGDVHVPYGSVPVDKAVQAKENERTNVIQSGDNGWNHASFNLRRVPLDDKAFRQLLVRLWDTEYHIGKVMKNIGAINGDLAAPGSYKEYRPNEPGHESLEKFSFFAPSSDGDLVDVQAARDFLLNHPDAKHDYSLGEAASDNTNSSDGQAIYVNGKPLGEAHTNNDGNGGQGPLEFSLNPPKDQPQLIQSFNRWFDIIQTVGIPITKSVESFNSQLPKVYAQENFDIFEMGWTGVSPQITYLNQFFGEAGADLDGSSDAQLFNAMGYTGAQDLIDQQAAEMDPEKRKPIVMDALLQIYEDCPTQIFQYEQVLQPVSADWTGWVQAPGGVRNRFTWLNVRQK